LIAEGVHAKKIAERLGHSSIKLTMDTYGHLFEGSDRESAQRMDRLFSSPVEGQSPLATVSKTAKVLHFPKAVFDRHADKNADKKQNPLAGMFVSD
jgi:hypothetical protein